ncbi:MAG TPA: rod shape-determining protein MreD [Oscillatoriaceae cyanobacterium M33_DOE_052]|uniref:Rod shape-determining protein MreD n=1 Tax=Planktothricoides sp. SpSt-374 TaxID=2282167 RepID=A0A7C3ZJD8_9CYAN|nr:rod shape-determining protein MreD [Oscillatoriaceae cyanobacterium M33_DOE_052]
MKTFLWGRRVHLSPAARKILNGVVTVASVFLCLLMLPVRLPGMELLNIGPNWLLIWVVAWSIKRSPVAGCCAGVTLGLLQDGMTAAIPSHVLGLAAVGFLTGRIQKQKYLQEDFISVALIVFGMVLVSETFMALQFALIGNSSIEAIWLQYQRIALVSAILSSLWAPVLYFPLNQWWQKMQALHQ